MVEGEGPDQSPLEEAAFSRQRLLGQAARWGAMVALPAGLGNPLHLDRLFSNGSLNGTIVLGNYPGWIGKNEIACSRRRTPA